MFEEKPEISETLEWMLQSRQVGDETLVNTLIHEKYASLYSLALSFFNAPDSESAEKLTEQVITEAVEDANLYQPEIRVEIWLYQKAFNTFQRWTSSKVLQKTRVKDNLETEGEHSPHGDALVIWKAIDGMQEDHRLVFTLKFQQELTNKEIAAVLDISEPDVEMRSSAAEGAFVNYIEDQRDVGFSRTEIDNALTERWPAPVLSAREEKKTTRKILYTLKENERRKHRVVVLGEMLLVVIAILVVAGMGRAITALSPEPTQIGSIYQTQIIHQVIYISPTPQPIRPLTPFPEMAILYEAEEGETLAEIAERNSIDVHILAALNNFLPYQPLEAGQEVMIGMNNPAISMNKPTPITPMPALEPLSPLASNAEIRQRILGSKSNWHTLWADILMIQYGPKGYIGEPNVKRQQVWISQPSYSLLISGDSLLEVENLSLAVGGFIYNTNLQTGEQLSITSSGFVDYSLEIYKLLLPNQSKDQFGGEIWIQALEEQANRKVLVIDWHEIYGEGDAKQRIHRGRYWVDAQTGVILRRQRFIDNELKQLFDDTVITRIEYDIDIPPWLFDQSRPSMIKFAKDHSGEQITEVNQIPLPTSSSQILREPFTRVTPPQNFDPTRRSLTFQWTSLTTFNPERGAFIDLFSGDYFLGNIKFTDPDGLMCTRSSDGKLLAFTSFSDQVLGVYEPLQWLSLTDLPRVNQFLPEIIPYDFAFAPDNRQLAVYGCEQQVEAGCGIYIIDTESGETRWLTEVEQGSGLIWKPDSSAFAIQGSFLRQGKWRVLVFDAETGNVLFDGPFDWEGFWVAPDTPIHDWGVPYPPTRGGLEICSEPPEGG